MCGRNPTLANRVTCAANELCNVLRTERVDSFGELLELAVTFFFYVVFLYLSLKREKAYTHTGIFHTPT